ncbi:hypothetical protein NUU61_002126 [Penicillium alfredii]|uniref:Uncharacterized protein n=1 Tax=Penicillium alfredii TaxID=1506179 RepID=A0A9W9FR50_9EURO|nr:uncharacterized protein NUU61_002126 [Penicillium alfredii]KAJ5104779.1 hypothetical protein NUU61_002126 [Penicillium alfredii]
MDANLLPDFQLLSYSSQSDHPPPSIDPVTLNISSSWTYCGPLLSLDPCSLPASFNTWAHATVKGSVLAPLCAFLGFVHEFLAANGLSHYWLTIRASQGSHEFDVPRWHTDDLFFSPPPSSSSSSSSQPTRRRRTSRLASFSLPPQLSRWGLHSRSQHQQKYQEHNEYHHPRPRQKQQQQQSEIENPSILPDDPQFLSTTPAQIIAPSTNPPNWKLATTLLGPGTLFMAPGTGPLARNAQRTAKDAARAANPGHVCLSVCCVGCATAAESVRARLAAELGQQSIVQAQPGQCVFFRVGEDEGAVHSEPRSHGDRIFVNVVPGHEGDLRAQMARWGMEFPRAWCVDLPMQLDGGVHLRDVGGS